MVQNCTKLKAGFSGLSFVYLFPIVIAFCETRISSYVCNLPSPNPKEQIDNRNTDHCHSSACVDSPWLLDSSNNTSEKFICFDCQLVWLFPLVWKQVYLWRQSRSDTLHSLACDQNDYFTKINLDTDSRTNRKIELLVTNRRENQSAKNCIQVYQSTHFLINRNCLQKTTNSVSVWSRHPKFLDCGFWPTVSQTHRREQELMKLCSNSHRFFPQFISIFDHQAIRLFCSCGNWQWNILSMQGKWEITEVETLACISECPGLCELFAIKHSLDASKMCEISWCHLVFFGVKASASLKKVLRRHTECWSLAKKEFLPDSQSLPDNVQKQGERICTHTSDFHRLKIVLDPNISWIFLLNCECHSNKTSSRQHCGQALNNTNNKEVWTFPQDFDERGLTWLSWHRIGVLWNFGCWNCVNLGVCPELLESDFR